MSFQISDERRNWFREIHILSIYVEALSVTAVEIVFLNKVQSLYSFILSQIRSFI